MVTLPHQELDWNQLWQQALAAKSSRGKGEAEWDGRAADFARRVERSGYTRTCLELLNPPADWSVLDVGSGPGTLALPLAERCRRVTAIDFSAQMLSILRQRAEERQLTNITTCKLSWTDDWQGAAIGRHDLVIASRSLAVNDLQAALAKLTAFARHRVAVTDRVGFGPLDPAAFAAIGRELNPGPDYIFTVNLLYQMGYLAEVSFIALAEPGRYSSLEQALNRYTWMFGELSGEERGRLEQYVRSIATPADDGTLTLRPAHTPTWAFISWQPRPGQ